MRNAIYTYKEINNNGKQEKVHTHGKGTGSRHTVYAVIDSLSHYKESVRMKVCRTVTA